ncbi:MAG: NAD(P)-binding domain-containing protein [Brevinemataceae bacterium]
MYKVAVIGAGPAGIAMAAELVESGISADQILICEKSQHDNASIRQFYPVGKDINSVYKNIQTEIKGVVGFSGIIGLDAYFTMMNNVLEKTKCTILFNTEVQKVKKQDDHFILDTSKGEFQAEYVVLASGVFAKPRRPEYPIPAKLLPNVSFDISGFQKNNLSNLHVLVVGGGDSASEYAQALVQLGNKVSLSYRQDNFFRMNQLNKDRLHECETNGNLSVMLATNIASIEEHEGKIHVNFVEGNILDVDRIVYALGGASPSMFMSNCGIDYDDNNVQLNNFHETGIPKLFMIGDLSQGRKGGSLMLAFNAARDAMEGLHSKYQFPVPKSI